MSKLKKNILEEKEEKIDQQYLGMYKEYNLLLKNWKFGFAAAILSIIITLVTRDNSKYELKEFTTPLYLLILGILFQVIISFINKTNNWILSNTTLKHRWFYKWAKSISNYYIIDFLLDLATIILFVTSIFLLLSCINK